MKHWIAILALAGCAAPPIEPITPKPEVLDPDPFEPRAEPEPPAEPAGVTPPGRHRPTTEPAIDRPSRTPDFTVEVCDFHDNDGDGQVDERVANQCGECGGDEIDGTDDDCDGLVDEGHIGALCIDDGDCESALSCFDGICSASCPAECAECDRCVGHLTADDDALIISPDCEEYCSTCRRDCDAAGGVCVGGECVRDGREVGCRPDEVEEVFLSRWVEQGQVVGRLALLCWP